MVTLTINLSEKDMEWIKKIAIKQHIPEDVLIRKFILDSLEKYRIDEAVSMYKSKKLTLNASAQFASMSVREFMNELENRNVGLNLTQDMVEQSLKVLAESFDNDRLMKAMNS